MLSNKMKKFRVTFYESVAYEIEVEAENSEEAVNIAADNYSSKNLCYAELVDREVEEISDVKSS